MQDEPNFGYAIGVSSTGQIIVAKKSTTDSKYKKFIFTGTEES